MFTANSAMTHRTCWKLLPWYVNGTLQAAEHEGVERHLETCEPCREEVASLGDLQEHVQSENRQEPRTLAQSPAMALERGLRQTLDRIDVEPRLRFRTSPTVRWLLAGQAAAIVLLASLLVRPQTPAGPKTFHTLSDRPVAQETTDVRDTLRIVFDSRATEAEIRHLLRSAEAEIVAGPSEVGAYTLRVPPASDSTRLATLRADPLVRLVESVRR